VSLIPPLFQKRAVVAGVLSTGVRHTLRPRNAVNNATQYYITSVAANRGANMASTVDARFNTAVSEMVTNTRAFLDEWKAQCQQNSVWNARNFEKEVQGRATIDTINVSSLLRPIILAQQRPLTLRIAGSV
jgi:hypothetical protein